MLLQFNGQSTGPNFVTWDIISRNATEQYLLAYSWCSGIIFFWSMMTLSRSTYSFSIRHGSYNDFNHFISATEVVCSQSSIENKYCKFNAFSWPLRVFCQRLGENLVHIDVNFFHYDLFHFLSCEFVIWQIYVEVIDFVFFFCGYFWRKCFKKTSTFLFIISRQKSKGNCRSPWLIIIGLETSSFIEILVVVTWYMLFMTRIKFWENSLLFQYIP